MERADDRGVTSGPHTRLMRQSLRHVGVKAVVLSEYLVLAAAVAATVWALVAGYQRPAGCVDTCFFPVAVLFLGMLAVLMLFIAAAAALGIATIYERRLVRHGLPARRGRGAMGAGTVVAAAGLLVAVLAIVLFWVTAGVISMLT